MIQQKTRILCRLIDEDNVDEVLQPLLAHPSQRVITDVINVGCACVGIPLTFR